MIRKKLTVLAMLLLVAAVAASMTSCITVDIIDEEGTVNVEDITEDGETPVTEATPEESKEDEKLFPDFTAEYLDGGTADNTLFSENKLTMLNIWATFCGPCINEMPGIAELAEEYADKGFAVVGIIADVMNDDGSISEDLLEEARSIISQTGANYKHILPSESLFESKLKEVSAVPETVFVDENGRLVSGSIIGSHTKEQWIDIIDMIFADMEKAADDASKQ